MLSFTASGQLRAFSDVQPSLQTPIPQRAEDGLYSRPNLLGSEYFDTLAAELAEKLEIPPERILFNDTRTRYESSWPNQKVFYDTQVVLPAGTPQEEVSKAVSTLKSIPPYPENDLSVPFTIEILPIRQSTVKETALFQPGTVAPPGKDPPTLPPSSPESISPTTPGPPGSPGTGPSAGAPAPDGDNGDKGVVIPPGTATLPGVFPGPSLAPSGGNSSGNGPPVPPGPTPSGAPPDVPSSTPEMPPSGSGQPPSTSPSQTLDRSSPVLSFTASGQLQAFSDVELRAFSDVEPSLQTPTPQRAEDGLYSKPNLLGSQYFDTLAEELAEKLEIAPERILFNDTRTRYESPWPNMKVFYDTQVVLPAGTPQEEVTKAVSTLRSIPPYPENDLSVPFTIETLPIRQSTVEETALFQPGTVAPSGQTSPALPPSSPESSPTTPGPPGYQGLPGAPAPDGGSGDKGIIIPPGTDAKPVDSPSPSLPPGSSVPSTGTQGPPGTILPGTPPDVPSSIPGMPPSGSAFPPPSPESSPTTPGPPGSPGTGPSAAPAPDGNNGDKGILIPPGTANPPGDSPGPSLAPGGNSSGNGPQVPPGPTYPGAPPDVPPSIPEMPPSGSAQPPSTPPSSPSPSQTLDRSSPVLSFTASGQLQAFTDVQPKPSLQTPTPQRPEGGLHSRPNLLGSRYFDTLAEELAEKLEIPPEQILFNDTRTRYESSWPNMKVFYDTQVVLPAGTSKEEVSKAVSTLRSIPPYPENDLSVPFTIETLPIRQSTVEETPLFQPEAMAPPGKDPPALPPSSPDSSPTTPGPPGSPGTGPSGAPAPDGDNGDKGIVTPPGTANPPGDSPGPSLAPGGSSSGNGPRVPPGPTPSGAPPDVPPSIPGMPPSGSGQPHSTPPSQTLDRSSPVLSFTASGQLQAFSDVQPSLQTPTPQRPEDGLHSRPNLLGSRYFDTLAEELAEKLEIPPERILFNDTRTRYESSWPNMKVFYDTQVVLPAGTPQEEVNKAVSTLRSIPPYPENDLSVPFTIETLPIRQSTVEETPLYQPGMVRPPGQTPPALPPSSPDSSPTMNGPPGSPGTGPSGAPAPDGDSGDKGVVILPGTATPPGDSPGPSLAPGGNSSGNGPRVPPGPTYPGASPDVPPSTPGMPPSAPAGPPSTPPSQTLDGSSPVLSFTASGQLQAFSDVQPGLQTPTPQRPEDGLYSKPSLLGSQYFDTLAAELAEKLEIAPEQILFNDTRTREPVWPNMKVFYDTQVVLPAGTPQEEVTKAVSTLRSIPPYPENDLSVPFTIETLPIRQSTVEETALFQPRAVAPPGQTSPALPPSSPESSPTTPGPPGSPGTVPSGAPAPDGGSGDKGIVIPPGTATPSGVSPGPSLAPGSSVPSTGPLGPPGPILPGAPPDVPSTSPGMPPSGSADPPSSPESSPTTPGPPGSPGTGPSGAPAPDDVGGSGDRGVVVPVDETASRPPNIGDSGSRNPVVDDDPGLETPILIGALLGALLLLCLCIAGFVIGRGRKRDDSRGDRAASAAAANAEEGMGGAAGKGHSHLDISTWDMTIAQNPLAGSGESLPEMAQNPMPGSSRNMAMIQDPISVIPFSPRISPPDTPPHSPRTIGVEVPPDQLQSAAATQALALAMLQAAHNMPTSSDEAFVQTSVHRVCGETISAQEFELPETWRDQQDAEGCHCVISPTSEPQVSIPVAELLRRLQAEAKAKERQERGQY